MNHSKSIQHHDEPSSHAEAASEERFVEDALESTGAAEGLMAATKNGPRVLKVLKCIACVCFIMFRCVSSTCLLRDDECGKPAMLFKAARTAAVVLGEFGLQEILMAWCCGQLLKW